MADVPGLIPGASTGKGLGVQFLRHVERCAVLVHVVDMATMEPGRDPESDIEALEHELAEYGGDELDLVGRLRIAVLNKIDVPDARELVDLVRASLEKRGLARLPGQRRDRRGADRVRLRAGRARSRSTARACRRWSRPGSPSPPGRRRLRLHRRARPGRTDGGFVVRGVRPERWVRQTDFSNDEAVGFLADRLNRLGVEEELAKAGAVEGDAVTIGGVTFDWDADPAGRHAHRRGVRGPGRPRHRQPHRRAAPASAPRSGWRPRRPAGCRTSSATRPGPTTTCRTTPAARGRRRRGEPRRPEIAGARRVVVKVGSSSLTTLPGGLDADRLSALVDVLGRCARRRPGGRAGLLRRDRRRPGAAAADRPAA